ncbi:MAG: hypothetical protein AAFR32_00735 [Pseudomonadota bacterium]
MAGSLLEPRVVSKAASKAGSKADWTGVSKGVWPAEWRDGCVFDFAHQTVLLAIEL